jgi:diamine N-acetyltransferase
LEQYSGEIKFKKAELSDIPIIHELAEKIWRKHYPDIISNEQIDYMLLKMYSQNSLKEQFEEGHQFMMILMDDKPLGYLSFSNKGGGNYFLHKFYIDTGQHRKGLGKLLFDFSFSKIPDIKTIRLTVNRKNYTAINYYFKNGFNIEEVKDFDIGNGFMMNDFVMVKSI